MNKGKTTTKLQRLSKHAKLKMAWHNSDIKVFGLNKSKWA